jgi:CRISPR-associated protein, Crm2 family
MTFQKPDTGYWERKFIAYMHDPPDKILQIKGHGDRAARFLEKFGLQKPNEEFWKRADAIAAGFERGQVPSYSPDNNKNGAVDFLKNPTITHPTSEKAQLKILLTSADTDETAETINRKLIDFIETNIGIKAGQGGYSDEFKGDEDGFAVARFLYTHLALRFKLAERNIGDLGAFWHRIPADSRFPDHSIWQHNVLCSALSSCIELAGNDTEIGLMVFSITPVQPFIAKARKLRDYWTGSVLLSWLAFEGIKWVIENIGPDHIMYPSLIDQPLINQYLEKNWSVKDVNFLNNQNDIASFPNKFLFLAPMNMSRNIADEIKRHISLEWKAFCENAGRTICEALGDLPEEEKNHVMDMFKRQNAHFWDFQWATVNLLKKDNRDEIAILLPENTFNKQFAVLERFNKIIEDKEYYDKSGRGVLYSVSHALVQSALAAAKTRKMVNREPETGEKCHICGEFEVLHGSKYEGDIPANEYKKNIKELWDKLKIKWDGDDDNPLSYDFNPNEKLCSVCLVKRTAYRVIENMNDHILLSAFKGKKQFESTTGMALHDYFRRNQTPDYQKKKFTQKIHERSEEEANNTDRYYAILMMDGDKMGKLVNGETLASTWKSVMHPDIVERLEHPEFEKKYRDNWKDILEKSPQRLLTPAIHAAISEALGDFSIYGVAPIIKKHEGALIYAGGDDVCAILPRETALSAAQEIRRYYISAFKLIQKETVVKDVSDNWVPLPGKLSINLGKGKDTSISAAILLCHHKESLSFMIKRAHWLLDEKAKKEAGRNSCAIELRKRSGGSRFFVRKWPDDAEDNDTTWKSFEAIGGAIQNKKKAQVSTSLVYRMERYRDGIEAIIKHENHKEMLKNFIAVQLDRSSVGNKNERAAFAEQMADIVVVEDKNKKRQYKPEALIVAAFMAEGGDDD